MRWLDEHGFKPVETEVRMCAEWVADIAGIIIPTETETIGLKIMPRKPRWNETNGMEKYQAWSEKFNALPAFNTALVEVKTSINDFRQDKKWTRPAPTNLRFLAIPRGLVKPEELPAGWWVLECTSKRIYTTRTGDIMPVSAEQQRDVAFNIALRRDHHTRHARLRAAQKVLRFEQGERETVTRVNKIVSMVAHIYEGGMDADDTLERVLSCYGIKRLPDYTMKKLQAVWGKGKPSEMGSY